MLYCALRVHAHRQAYKTPCKHGIWGLEGHAFSYLHRDTSRSKDFSQRFGWNLVRCYIPRHLSQDVCQSTDVQWIGIPLVEDSP